MSESKNARSDGLETFLLGVHLKQSGTAFVSLLEKAFKVRSRQLHQALKAHTQEAGLMRVQEALSRAVGFADTHALQESLKRLHAGLAPLQNHARREKWTSENGPLINQFSSLGLLLRDFTGKTPLEDSLQERLARWASLLGKHLDLDMQIMLPAVATAWAGESNWNDLQDRNPTNRDPGPLLSFRVFGDPSSRSSQGEFSLSEEGHWIWDHVLGSESAPEEGADEEQVGEAFETAMELTGKHPDLLVAWTRAAHLAMTQPCLFDGFEGGLRVARRLLEEGLRHAEALMPKGFKGSLTGTFDDRRYLQASMMLAKCLTESDLDLKKAFVVTKKVRRLSPDTSIGQAEHCMLHLAVKGRTPAGDKLVAAVSHSALGLIHAAIALLFLRDPAGVAPLLEAVVQVPAFGFLLSIDQETGTPDRDLSFLEHRRGISYSDPVEHLSFALALLCGDPSLSIWIRAVLADRTFQVEEARLNRLCEQELTSDRPSLQRWNSAVSARVSAIAPVVLERYPLAAA